MGDERDATETTCLRLLKAFYAALDGRRNDAAAACFVADGTWFRMSESIEGAAAIRQALDARFPDALVIHALSNVHFTEVAADEATSEALVVVYVGKPGEDGKPGTGGLRAVTRAETRYRRTPDGWRIAAHDGRPLMTV